jgi:hypothetical protein
MAYRNQLEILPHVQKAREPEDRVTVVSACSWLLLFPNNTEQPE